MRSITCLKPFSSVRFSATLAHAREQLDRHRAGDLGTQAARSSRRPCGRRAGAGSAERLLVRSTGRVHFVRTSEIDWCEAAGNYVRLHVGEESHLFRETMNGLESKLDPQHFVRIHRKTIVNVERIEELRSSLAGECTVYLRNGAKLTLSRGYREGFQERFGKSPVVGWRTCSTRWPSTIPDGHEVRLGQLWAQRTAVLGIRPALRLPVLPAAGR